MKAYILTLVVVLATFCRTITIAQVAQADQQYNDLAFAKAIEYYEQALKTNLKDTTKTHVLARLADSYRQVRNTVGAERVYRELISQKTTGLDKNIYLYFAQALANNGKYEEAKEAYEKYDALQQTDTRAKEFTKLYTNLNVLSKNSTSYSIESLDNINTNRAEFSPTYYKDGLVFVSARNEGINIKRIYSWNNTAFLDLYHIPDLSIVNAGKTSKLGGSSTTTKTRTKGVYMLGADEYTTPTPNDSKTMGFYQSWSEATNEPVQTANVSAQSMGKSLNSKYHEGPVAFYNDGNKILFTRNNYLNGNYKTSKEGINKLKLYSADLDGNTWKNITELPFNSDEYSTGHPTVTKDDKLLYFVSDMPGGYGGTDIYVSKFDGSSWSSPLNLGPAINSKGNEMFPFVDDKGNLYFSSDGLAGMGGLDIFYAKLIDGVMARKPTNLGVPINSNKDDFGLITDGERKSGFFSSNRKRGEADDDLFRFERSGPLNPCQEIIVKVYDADTKAPLTSAAVEMVNKTDETSDAKTLNTDGEGKVSICLDTDMDFVFKAANEGYLNNSTNFTTKDLEDAEVINVEIALEKVKPKVKTFTIRGLVSTQRDKKPIAGVKVILRNECDGSQQETETDANGTYAFEVPEGCDYSIEALKDNLGTMGSKIKPGETAEANITMFEKGDIIKIENIYYDLNKWEIRPDASAELDKLVALMNKYPNMRIEFGSHTDSRSSAKYNKTLSTKRAKAAVAYIVKQGINSKRIVAAGYGESKLVNKCKDGVKCTEEEHQQNRRTEIKILNL